ncbi:DUF416 family protein [uncultured Croceitalea sp.]|uniref:DUF416 family protein n=1 Tax=uncultured Croceitalea sp. TaxID=1798908 RepID=UPI00374EB1CB
MDKYAVRLKENVEKLSAKNKLLFAFWVSKRLFHNYVFFNEKTSYGDIDVMLDALNQIEKYINNSTVDNDEILNTITVVEANTPDTNNFDTILASFALDACSALIESLNFIIDQDIKYIVNVGVFARDTIDMFIQELEDMDYDDSNFESKIKNHTLMKQEMSDQNVMLSKLSNDEDVWNYIKYDRIIDPSLIKHH